MVGLGDLPGGRFASYATAVGGGTSAAASEAFVWTEPAGMRRL